jgi:hypothetical protein
MTRRPLHALSVAATLALSGPACGGRGTSGDSTQTVRCSPDASPVFLSSKWDDDDGDGLYLDEDYPTIDDEDDDIADHAWVRDELGRFHLFFHNEGSGSGSHIEHYVSTDLRSLEYAGVALRTNPDGWDSDGLWAPSVVEYGGVYFMFYTGVEGRGSGSVQRIGLATSEDLVTWTRLPVNRCPGTTGDGCIYECDEPWTTWGGPPGDYNQQCRDPFVLWDPDNERWVLFATARSKNGFGVVTVAYSTDRVQWSGGGFIDGTRRLASGIDGQTTGGQAENPHVMSRSGTYYLLFTDWEDPEDTLTVPDPRTQVQYLTSGTLTADTLGSANWVYRGYTSDPGVNAIEVQQVGNAWVMSQSIANPLSGDHALHRRDLRLKCVLWEGPFSFHTSGLEIRPQWRGATPNP